ncbi:MAG: histidine kinase [Actinomycetota bacterium]
MTRRTASRLAWGLFALGLVIFAAATWLSLAADAAFDVAPFLPILLSFSGVGAFVASRRPENSLGWVMLSFAAISLGLLADAYAQYGLTRSPVAGGTDWAAWAFMISIELTYMPLLLLLLLFPHGRLLSRRWRPIAWGVVIVSLVGAAATGISDVNFSASGNFPKLRDPVQLLPRSAVSPVYGVYQGIVVVLFLLAAASLVLRFRRSRGEERQQLKWIAFAGALAAVGLAVLATLPLGIEPVVAFVALVPLIAVAAGIAILKYRLYDIDVVINKTIVYGALAGFITGVYVAIVVGVGSLVGKTGRPNVPLSILATAVVAVAFQPVRERVQHLANRLVYGVRATPYEVLSEFSERMAGTYAAEELLPRMARTLAEGTGAERAEVWLRVGDELRLDAAWPEDDVHRARIALADEDPGEVPGANRTVEVRHRGELLGVLAVAKRPGEPLTTTEDKLLADLASQAGLVLRNVGLTEELLARLDELKASRQRLVAAQDEERRRLERNIHDGAQQQLVALAIKIRLAESMLDKDVERTRAMLDQARAQTQGAIDDLRDLARGIYPPLLADRGLAAALEAQGRKSAVPVEVTANAIGRFPQEVEAAVYFCVLEALQNVAKYAHATRAWIEISNGAGRLEFRVRDDGTGFDVASVPRGSGLQNMADRLAALDGSVEIDSAPGRGATVIGHIPIGRPAADS